LHMAHPKEDRTRYELHIHLSKMGIEGRLIDPGVLDLDYDYPYLDLDGPVSGATSLGSIRLHGYPINIANIVREKTYEIGHMGFGGDYGPHEYVSSGWRLRFFYTDYAEGAPRHPELTEFHITTKVKVEKKFLGTKVVDFKWEAPNVNRTRIEAEILDRLNSDSGLQSMLLQELVQERTITLKSYRPRKTLEQIGAAEASYARIVLYGELRKRKDIFITTNGLNMYNKMMEHVLQAKAAL